MSTNYFFVKNYENTPEFYTTHFYNTKGYESRRVIHEIISTVKLACDAYHDTICEVVLTGVEKFRLRFYYMNDRLCEIGYYQVIGVNRRWTSKEYYYFATEGVSYRRRDGRSVEQFYSVSPRSMLKAFKAEFTPAMIDSITGGVTASYVGLIDKIKTVLDGLNRAEVRGYADSIKTDLTGASGNATFIAKLLQQINLMSVGDSMAITESIKSGVSKFKESLKESLSVIDLDNATVFLQHYNGDWTVFPLQSNRIIRYKSLEQIPHKFKAQYDLLTIMRDDNEDDGVHWSSSPFTYQYSPRVGVYNDAGNVFVLFGQVE